MIEYLEFVLEVSLGRPFTGSTYTPKAFLQPGQLVNSVIYLWHTPAPQARPSARR